MHLLIYKGRQSHFYNHLVLQIKDRYHHKQDFNHIFLLTVRIIFWKIFL